MIANLLDRELEASDHAVEGRGAAMTAAVALGWYSDIDTAGIGMAQVTRRVRPDPEQVPAYRALYAAWRELDDATQALDRR
jgi:sugar (pentulose or hexulose) kinase